MTQGNLDKNQKEKDNCSSQSAFDLFIDEANALAWLKFNHPAAEMNTLHQQHFTEMSSVLDKLEQNKTLKGLIIYSGKADHFIVGADIKMLDSLQTKAEIQTLVTQGQALFSRIEALPFHVVAAINGACLGGGLELALACHSRIVTADTHTRLALPEVKLGLLPGCGGTQRLPRLIGLMPSLKLMLSGQSVSAKQAYKLGLVDDVIPAAILHEVAQKRALQEKPKPLSSWSKKWVQQNPVLQACVFYFAAKKITHKTRDNYPATKAIIEVVKIGLKKGKDVGYRFEAEQFAKLVLTRESIALRQLFFATNRVKKATSEQITPDTINKIALLGGGAMGAGITYVSAKHADFFVRIKERDDTACRHALSRIYQIYAKKNKQKKGAFTYPLASKIGVCSDFSRLSGCDFVIEAVPEDLLLKQEMVKGIEKQLSEHTFFATNTSSLSIASIAEKAKRPQHIIGLHYFSPVEKMPLVEIIPHQATAKNTLDAAFYVAKRQGKIPIVVKDSPGFYVNRILAPYINEAAKVLLSGEKIEYIDNALLDFGFPVGPLHLLDEVGIGLCAKIAPQLNAAFGARFTPPSVFDVLLKDGREGRQANKGFYRYKKLRHGVKKKADKKIYSLLNIKSHAQYSSYEIAERCVLMMLNEAARCLDEGVIRSPEEGDVGAVFGIGFPPFLGGPFRYMDSLGFDQLITKLQMHENRYGDCFAPCDALLKRAKNKQPYYPHTQTT